MVGIGIDAVEIDRFRAVLARRPRLAARWAAKEAVMKALGVGIGAFAFCDVEVVSAPSGAPSLVLRGADRSISPISSGVTMGIIFRERRPRPRPPGRCG